MESIEKSHKKLSEQGLRNNYLSGTLHLGTLRQKCTQQQDAKAVLYPRYPRPQSSLYWGRGYTQDRWIDKLFYTGKACRLVLPVLYYKPIPLFKSMVGIGCLYVMYNIIIDLYRINY